MVHVLTKAGNAFGAGCGHDAISSDDWKSLQPASELKLTELPGVASAPVCAVERRLLLAEPPKRPPASGGPHGVQLRLGFRALRGCRFGGIAAGAGRWLMAWLHDCNF